jgi:hypothetical protein
VGSTSFIPRPLPADPGPGRSPRPIPAGAPASRTRSDRHVIVDTDIVDADIVDADMRPRNTITADRRIVTDPDGVVDLALRRSSCRDWRGAATGFPQEMRPNEET